MLARVCVFGCVGAGMDFYFAACAPHVTDWGTAPPIRGSYDYLLNTVSIPRTAWGGGGGASLPS